MTKVEAISRALLKINAPDANPDELYPADWPTPELAGKPAWTDYQWAAEAHIAAFDILSERSRCSH